MRELHVWPGVVGFEVLWSEMQDPWVICGDLGFEDADCCQVEEGAVEYAGDIKLAKHAQTCFGRCDVRIVLRIPPNPYIWFSSGQISQVIQQVVGERVRMGCVSRKVGERGELDRERNECF
jgi:hypothetical protein